MANYMRFNTIHDIQHYNKVTGHYFFEKDTMHFFDSIAYNNVYHGESENQWNYFITSEKFDDNFPRLFTIRRLLVDGDTETIGRFQQYESFYEAEDVLLAMLEQEGAE